MDKLVEYIAKSLVDHPESVRVTKREEDDSVVVSPADSLPQGVWEIDEDGRFYADPIQKEVLPTTMKDHTVYVYTIEETLAHAKDHPEEKLFVICKFPADALALLEAGVEVEEINVGNAAPLPGSDYRLVTKSIAVTPEEAKIYRQIADLRGGVLTSRLTTMNETDDFLGLLEKNGL